MAKTLPRGLLIALEGIDGTGKSTQARLLCERLAADGFAVVATREPTDGVHGQRLRASAASGRLAPADELALFIADRREHVAGVIRPALASGSIVIVDRYYFSTAAYQGARGLDPAQIIEENERFAPRPDLLLLIDLPVDVALRRIRDREGGAGNLFERRDALVRVAHIFATLEQPAVRIDGAGDVERVRDAILAAVRPAIERALTATRSAPRPPAR